MQIVMGRSIGFQCRRPVLILVETVIGGLQNEGRNPYDFYPMTLAANFEHGVCFSTQTSAVWTC